MPVTLKHWTEAPALDLRPETEGAGPHHRRLRYWIPALFVSLAFLALLIVPYVLTLRTNELRNEVVAAANPAHEAVDEINLTLATEGPALRAYFLSHDPRFLARYREAKRRQQEALERMQPFIEKMAGKTLPAFAEMHVALERWHQSQEQLLEEGITREQYIGHLAESQHLYEQAFAATKALAAEIAHYTAVRRRQIIETDRFDTVMTVSLAFVGLLATFAVAWLTVRLSRLAMQLDRRAREEMAFRQVASTLTGAINVDEVLVEVTRSAELVTRADGAYVEKIHGETVEIVTSSGRGAPARGTRTRYPGSLTEEIIGSGKPVILADMNGFGEQMAPYLKQSCSNCELLIIPLLADREALGALVLLNSTTSGRHFGLGDAQRAKALGDLVSLALRRVAMIDREREARQAAQAALKTRDEFLGIVSHDLRNPLTAVLLSASMLAQDAEGETLEQVEAIRSSAERMQRLIRDLLDAARVEGGRLPLRLETLHVAEILEEVCEEHRALADQKKVQLEVDVPASLPDVSGDHDRLMQLLGNLVGNAVKFTPAAGRVILGARHLGDRVEVSVADTGAGIPEHELSHVFERYWQSKKTAHLGAGLGLTIAKGIADSHGGTIQVANRREGGAVFTFTIPVADGPTDPLPATV